jgi:hypothetical protein
MYADLLTLTIRKNEEEVVTADSLNHSIATSSASSIFIRPEVLKRDIPLESALHLLCRKTAPQIIIFSDESWPLLFTRHAWTQLQRIPNQGCGAKVLTAGFIAHARHLRSVPLLQVFR